MPPRPEAAEPRAPFDPGRFSVDQITLSDLEERSGLDFDKLKDFDVLAAQPDTKVPPGGCPTASALEDYPRGRAGAPDGIASHASSAVARSAGAFTFAKKEAARLSVYNLTSLPGLLLAWQRV